MSVVKLPLRSEAAAAERELLRIVIVGHVDHGKSTLVGRLLHETGALPDGKLEMLKAVSARRGMPFEWSFLLDALQTERDLGITVDTSQIRFATPKRDYVLIDAPGHVEFLRNMVTGAAQADAALLLVDAAEGVREQTRRHAFLLHLLGIRQVAVVVNKMDRVGFSRDVFSAIETDITSYLAGFGVRAAVVIPVSARDGDLISGSSARLPWYGGPAVIAALDAFTAPPSLSNLPLRLPIQAVYKFDERRILAGRIESGRLAVGDELAFEPTGATARIRSIEAWPGPAPREAEAGQSVGITLDKEVFVSRGDVAAHPDQRPRAARSLRARLFWLDEAPLKAGDAVVVRLATAAAPGVVSAIARAVDPASLASQVKVGLGTNHVGEVEITLNRPLPADPHHLNPLTGRIVVERDRRIAGGGIVLGAAGEASRAPAAPAPVRGPLVAVESVIPPAERFARYRHKGAVVWLTGLPAAGKTTLARGLERQLFDMGGSPIYLDGDTLRTGLNSDLGFSAADRSENIRRVAEVAAFLAKNGHLVLAALVSPLRADRARAREICGAVFHEVHVSTALELCEARDPKGHYAKARAGQIPQFTGISAPYEAPEAPEVVVDTSVAPESSVSQLAAYLVDAGVLVVADVDSPI